MDGGKKRKGRATEAEIAAMEASQAQAAIRRLRGRLLVMPLDDLRVSGRSSEDASPGWR